MKLAVVFAAILAVSAAQFPGFGAQFQAKRPVAPRPSGVPSRPAAAAVSRGTGNDQNANTLRFDNDIGPDGSYSYAVETDNGISVQAQGTPRDFGGNPPLVPIVSQGSYSFVSSDGVPVSITYIADENGYQPSGDVLPTPHPIPEAILKSLEFIARAQKK